MLNLNKTANGRYVKFDGEVDGYYVRGASSVATGVQFCEAAAIDNFGGFMPIHPVNLPLEVRKEVARQISEVA